LSNIKPYSDKIPYFRRLLRSIWRIVIKPKLKLKSMWISIDLEKIYWVSSRKILFSLSKSESIERECKYEEENSFKY